MENTDRLQIELSAEETGMVVHHDSDEFHVVKSEIIGEWRHGTEYVAIVKRVSDSKFFSIPYRESPKDMDFTDMNYGGKFSEVFPEEVTIVAYR